VGTLLGGRGGLAGREMAATWVGAEAPAIAALVPMEEAATDTAARASRARLTSGGVIRRERSTRRRLPVSTPTP
jgi:hypothetical protein